MARQERFASGKRISERDAGKFGLEALLDDVPRDQIALRRSGCTRLSSDQPLVTSGHSSGYVGGAHAHIFVHTVHKVKILACIGFYKARVKRTGGVVSSSWVMVFTVRNGRIVRFREWSDSAQLNRAYGAAVL